MSRATKSAVVTFIVGTGSEATTFHIHKDLFVNKADIFTRMFNGGFEEGERGIAELPEDVVGAFEIFVEWLYTNDTELLFPDLNENRSDIAVETLIFADKYCVDELFNISMSAWISAEETLHGFREIGNITSRILEHSTPNSQSRRFLARLWAENVIFFGNGITFGGELDDDDYMAELHLFSGNPSFIAQIFDEIGVLKHDVPYMSSPFVHCDFHKHDGTSKECPQKPGKRGTNGIPDDWEDWVL